MPVVRSSPQSSKRDTASRRWCWGFESVPFRGDRCELEVPVQCSSSMVGREVCPYVRLKADRIRRLKPDLRTTGWAGHFG